MVVIRKIEERNILTLFQKLTSASLTRFPSNGYIIDAPDDQGVYIIYNQRNIVMHVGRTLRAKRGLYQRLQSHLRGNSSFINSYFKGNGEILRNGYEYKYLIIKDARQRALTEAMAIGKLCPEHLGLGKNIAGFRNCKTTLHGRFFGV